MFGKKKKQEETAASTAIAADSSSIETKGKPDKAKAKLEQKLRNLRGGINPAVLHVEKVILALVAGAASFLAYSSFSKPGLDQSQEPKRLSDQASQLMRDVSANHWEAIAPERVKFTNSQFSENTRSSREPVQGTLFPIGKLEPALVRDVIEKRKDPDNFPPQDLIVKNVAATVAIAVANPDDNPDPFSLLENADPIKRAAPPSRRNRPSASVGSEEDGSGGDSGSGFVPATAVPTKRRLKASYDLGAAFTTAGAGVLSGISDQGLDGSGEMSSFSGVAQPASGGKLGEGSRGPTHRIGTRQVMFNAITALIPHRKNFESYHSTLINTGTFLPVRDLPAYLGLEVQRVDVTGNWNREVKENEWVTIVTNREIADFPLNMFKEKNVKLPTSAWASHYPSTREKDKTTLGKPVPEVIDPRAVLRRLTAPIPPVLIRDYRTFSKHPAIDWSWNARTSTQRKTGPLPTRNTEEDDVVFDDSSSGRLGTGGFSDGPDGSGMEPMFDNSGFDSSGEESSYSDYGDSSMSMDSYSPGTNSSLLPENQPEFKMIRTYDFLTGQDAKAGKCFRYRMRVIMRDPNYPENQDFTYKGVPTPLIPAPENNELHHVVYERVIKLRRDDDKLIEEARNKKTFKVRTMRYTDWSAPSKPVCVIQPTEAFAGDIDGAKGIRMVVTQLTGDRRYPGAVLAAEVLADRGLVLGADPKKEGLEIISPTDKIVKKIEPVGVLPGLLVIDTRIGSKLAGDSNNDPLSAGNEVLIQRSDGSIFVSNTYDDLFLYRLYSFQEDKEAAKKASENTR